MLYYIPSWHRQEIATAPAPKKQPTKQATPAKPTIPVENYEASALWLQREGNTWPIIEQKYKVSAAATNYFNGSMQEIIIYNSALTDSEISNVKEYLNTKYKIY